MNLWLNCAAKNGQKSIGDDGSSINNLLLALLNEVYSFGIRVTPQEYVQGNIPSDRNVKNV